MRIRRQPGRVAELVAEIVNSIFADAAFEKCSRVDSGRGVALEVNEISGLIAIAGVKKVIESDFEQRG